MHSAVSIQSFDCQGIGREELKAKKELLPLQAGDVPDTYANVEDLMKDFNYRPSTSINDGVSKFVTWYREYYRV